MAPGPEKSGHQAKTKKEKNSSEASKGSTIPDILFRVWDSLSGGGPRISANNTTEVVPRGLMEQREPHILQKISPNELNKMAFKHLNEEEFDTPFSSWASSLHVALHFAKTLLYYNGTTCEDIHIAVIDKQALDYPIEAWHAPYLVPSYEHLDYEYLVRGVIRGRGYVAISLKDMLSKGLEKILRLEYSEDEYESDFFGRSSHRKTFHESPKRISTSNIKVVREIAELFGPHHFLPVACALLNLQPRMPYSNGLVETISRIWDISVEMTSQARFFQPWTYPGMAYTKKYEDVEQSINLLRRIVDRRNVGRISNETAAECDQPSNNITNVSNDMAKETETDNEGSQAANSSANVGQLEIETSNEKEPSIETTKASNATTDTSNPDGTKEKTTTKSPNPDQNKVNSKQAQQHPAQQDAQPNLTKDNQGVTKGPQSRSHKRKRTANDDGDDDTEGMPSLSGAQGQQVEDQNSWKHRLRPRKFFKCHKA